MLLCKVVLSAGWEKLTVCQAPRIILVQGDIACRVIIQEEMTMHIFRALIVVLFLVVSLNACVNAPGKERARVHCPECGAEFDAFYQKRF
jgi:hypothetical protein